MVNQIQVYYQEYFKYFLELTHSPSCLEQGLGQTLKPNILNPVFRFTKNKAPLNS